MASLTAPIDKLTLPQLYCEVNRIVNNGVAGYYVPKKYEDPIKQIQQRANLLKRKGQKTNKYVTKKGSYLQDQQHIHKLVPGVGKYNLIPPEQKVTKSRSMQNIQKKQTYLDEIFTKGKKEKFPGPSQYQIKEVKSQANINKLSPHDRITYLDEIQYQANEAPGVGNYNPRDRINTQAISSIWNQKPDYWKKKHLQQEKKQKHKPASPDAGSYDPQLKQLFASKLNGSSQTSQTNFMGGKSQRFKTQDNINIGPGKYVQLQQWKGKTSAKNIKYGLEAISKGSSKSVYYN